MRPEQLEAGQEILVATGERVGVDGAVSAGAGELDTSLITGETVPQRVAPGDRVFAGTINLGAPLAAAGARRSARARCWPRSSG